MSYSGGPKGYALCWVPSGLSHGNVNGGEGDEVEKYSRNRMTQFRNHFRKGSGEKEACYPEGLGWSDIISTQGEPARVQDLEGKVGVRRPRQLRGGSCPADSGKGVCSWADPTSRLKQDSPVVFHTVSRGGPGQPIGGPREAGPPPDSGEKRWWGPGGLEGQSLPGGRV